MRIAAYNVEWFNTLFDGENQLLADGGWSSRYNITRAQQAQALGDVFAAMDADGVMVIEAPDSSHHRDSAAAMESFARRFALRTRQAVTGFVNDTQQEITFLYDPDKITAQHDPMSGDKAPQFDETLLIDLDIDATRDKVRFSKPPLELRLRTVQGTELRMIGAHLKSKAPHGARNRDEAMRISIANRRKQLAQAIWLRRRVEQVIGGGESLILLGDLNDGPGLDEFEHLFGRSSVEVILGEGGAVRLYDPHAAQALRARFGAVPTTARFWLRHEKRYLQALLDYVMVSQDLRDRQATWRIWHPMDDPECWNTPALRDALVTASDHFPVTLDVDI